MEGRTHVGTVLFNVLDAVIATTCRQFVRAATYATSICVDSTPANRSATAYRPSSTTSNRLPLVVRVPRAVLTRCGWASRAGTTRPVRGLTAPGLTSPRCPSTPLSRRPQCPSQRTASRHPSLPFRTQPTTPTSIGYS